MSQPELVRDERFKGRRCGIDNCPSKRYFKIDGRIICDRGHEQEFLETVAEDDGMVPASSQVRRYKIDELDKSEPGEVKKRGVLKRRVLALWG
jgi:Zinc-finger of RNA-polymerase I-specific TFIIB, Rrn7